MHEVVALILISFVSIVTIISFITLKFFRNDIGFSAGEINRLGYIGSALLILVIAIFPKTLSMQAKMNAFEKIEDTITFEEMRSSQLRDKRIINESKIGNH